MRKFLFLFVVAALLISCKKDNNPDTNNNNSQDTEDTQIKISELYGVWKTDYNDSYIAFTEGGKYSFFFGNNLMGSGTFSLENKTVSLNNTYSNKTDKLEIDFVQNKLKVSGKIYLFDGTNTMAVNNLFEMSSETISPSLVGKEVKPNLYGSSPTTRTIYKGILFISDYLIQYTHIYEYKSTGKQKTSKRYWYYIYREPMLYVQETDGDGTITSYDTSKGQWPGI